MRQIKFRAWDDGKKKWIDGMVGFSVVGEMMMMGEWAHVLSKYFPDRLNDIIIEQFTGLVDDNGKEIYEGDVLRCGEYDLIYLVSFHKRGAFIAHHFNNIDDFFFLDDMTFQIIGNIHENPELLNN